MTITQQCERDAGIGGQTRSATDEHRVHIATLDRATIGDFARGLGYCLPDSVRVEISGPEVDLVSLNRDALHTAHGRAVGYFHGWISGRMFGFLESANLAVKAIKGA